MQSLMTRLLLGGGGGFSPSSLFFASEQGAWYDPSDLTTLFQDSAGTTPVTAVEQPVGLVLDKSKGLVLGPELVTNGDFSQGTTGWTAYASTLSVSGGEVTVTNSGVNYGQVYQTVTTVAGQWYKISATLRVGTAATVNLRAETALTAGNLFYQTTSSASNVVISGYFLATGTSTIVGCANANTNNGTGIFDNISVKSIAGNHAYQTTSASRPTLRARYNLLTYSEQFDNGVWTRSNVTITANSTTAPDGTTTADAMYETTANGEHKVSTTVTTSTTTYTYSAYVKPIGGRNFNLEIINTVSNGVYVVVNSTTGVVNASGVYGTGFTLVGTPTVTDAGNGWWRCSFTATVPATTVIAWVRAIDGALNIYAGDVNKGLFIWGAQLVPTAVFPSNTYQRIAAATDYATGAAFPPYLFFDGVDDSLLTNSVDFSATDKMTVWAGVTKNGTTAGTIVEPGGAVGTTANTFALLTSGSVAGDYWFSISGSAPISNDKYCADSATTFNAPITNVVSVSANKAGYPVAANSVSMRVNAATPTQTYATLGDWSSNFSNNIIYIGRRTNSTLPLNGNIYSLIIRGAQSTSDQIISTEQWVAQKSGITIP